MPYRFNWKDNETGDQFECNLESRRCQYTNPTTNRRCGRTVVIGLPNCWQHTLLNDNLRIKESNIPNAGKGLFALDKKAPANKVIFKPREKITNYEGQLLTKEQSFDRYGDKTAPYGLLLNDRYDIDSACSRGIGALINHSRRPNAAFVTNRQGAKVVALKRIRNNQEIFANYGRAYRFNEPVTFTTKYRRR